MSQDDLQTEVYCEEDKTAFEKISNLVGSTEWKIIENKASHEAWTKILENQQNRINENKLKTKIAEQHHNKNLKMQQEMVEKSNTSAMNNIACMERSVVYHLDLLNRSNLQKQEVKEKHENILKMYETQYEEIENIHKDVNPAHNDLHMIQTELLRNEIELKDLNVRIQTCDKAKQQFDDIQKRIYEQNMVGFAKFYVTYHENEKNLHELKILNQEKSKLLKEHLQLVATVKKESSMEKEKQRHVVSANGIGRETSNEQTMAKIAATNNRGDCYSKQLEDFIKADMKPLRKNLTALKATAAETPKIKILNVTEMEPPRKIIKKTEDGARTHINLSGLDVEFKKPKDFNKSSKCSKKVLAKKSVRFQECELTPKIQEKIHPSPSLFNLKDKNLSKDFDNKRKQTNEEPKKSLPDLKRLRQELLTKTTQRLSQELKQSSQRLSQEIKPSSQRSSQQMRQSMGQRLSQETKLKRSIQQNKSETAQQFDFMNDRSQDNLVSSMKTNVSQGFLFGTNEIRESSFPMFNTSMASELSTENENNSTSMEADEKNDALPGAFGGFDFQTPSLTASYINFDVMN